MRSRSALPGARRDDPAWRGGPVLALLVGGVGLAALAGMARRNTRRGDDADPVGYAPLDTPKQVARDVFVVDSVLPGPIGRVITARMTVLRLPNGALVLHSPTRLTASLHDALAALGPIRHLVAPNAAHWMFVRDWQAVLPDAIAWAAPGLRRRAQVRRSGVRFDHDLTPDAPEAWRGAITLVEVPGGFGFREMALFHGASRTLVLTDLVMNLEAARLPILLRPLARAFGSVAPDGMPPPHVRALFRRRLWDARLAAERLLACRPERVVFAHGQWFESDGTARLATSLRWLLEPQP